MSQIQLTCTYRRERASCPAKGATSAQPILFQRPRQAERVSWLLGPTERAVSLYLQRSLGRGAECCSVHPDDVWRFARFARCGCGCGNRSSCRAAYAPPPLGGGRMALVRCTFLLRLTRPTAAAGRRKCREHVQADTAAVRGGVEAWRRAGVSAGEGLPRTSTRRTPERGPGVGSARGAHSA